MGKGYEPRLAKRGSALITVLSDTPLAVLQMPRGNLEALYPRSLVLPHVMSLISKGEYGSAVEVMRRQKVDLNLLVDMNPYRFLLPTGDGDGGVGKGGGKGEGKASRLPLPPSPAGSRNLSGFISTSRFKSTFCLLMTSTAEPYSPFDIRLIT